MDLSFAQLDQQLDYSAMEGGFRTFDGEYQQPLYAIINPLKAQTCLQSMVAAIGWFHLRRIRLLGFSKKTTVNFRRRRAE